MSKITSTLEVNENTLSDEEVLSIRNYLEVQLKKTQKKAIPSPEIYNNLPAFKEILEVSCFNRALSLAIKAGRLPGVKSFIGRSGGIGFEDQSHVVKAKPIAKLNELKAIEKSSKKEEDNQKEIKTEEIIHSIIDEDLPTDREELSEEEEIKEFVKTQSFLKAREEKNLNDLKAVYSAKKETVELWISGRRFKCPISISQIQTILVKVFEAKEDENGDIILNNVKYSCLEAKVAQYFDNLLFYVYEASQEIVTEETNVKSA